MDVFYVDCEVEGIRRPSAGVRVPKLLVDTGAEFTWLPATTLRRAGVEVAKKDEPIVMARGRALRSPGRP